MGIDNLSDIVDPALKEALSNNRETVIDFRNGEFRLYRMYDSSISDGLVAKGETLFELVQNYKEIDES